MPKATKPKATKPKATKPKATKPKQQATGASSKDIDLMARNADHAELILSLKVVDSPRAFAQLFSIRDRFKQAAANVFTGPRESWKFTAEREREFLREQGDHARKVLDERIAEKQRDIKQLREAKRKLPRSK